MFSDNDNPSTAAAAAPAQDSEKEAPKTGNEAHGGTTETEATVNAAKEEATAAPVAQADGDPRPEQATAPAATAASGGAEAHGTEAHAEAAHAQATTPVDAEAAAAAEEAAGSEEMSKLIEQYSEPQEGAANNEIIEVKVVAYTEHGVVVDVGGKTEGLIPAAEFSETDIPRPEPNATIEVQRTGEHKDGFTYFVVPEGAAPPHVGKDRGGVQGERNRHRQSCGSHQGRPGRGYRRARVSPGIAIRSAARRRTSTTC